jgi:hypothetical protein
MSLVYLVRKLLSKLLSVFLAHSIISLALVFSLKEVPAIGSLSVGLKICAQTL